MCGKQILNKRFLRYVEDIQLMIISYGDAKEELNGSQIDSQCW